MTNRAVLSPANLLADNTLLFSVKTDVDVLGGSVNDLTDPQLSSILTAAAADPVQHRVGFTIDLLPPWTNQPMLFGLLGVSGAAASAVGTDAGTILFETYIGAAQVSSESVFPFVFSDSGFLRSFWFFMPSGLGINRVDLVLSSPDNLPWSIGGLYAGRALDIEIAQGWSMSIIDPGSMGRSISHQGYPRPAQHRRDLSATFAPLSFAEAFGDGTPGSVDLQSIIMGMGTTGIGAFFPQTADPATGVPDKIRRHRMGTYGHFTQIPVIHELPGDLWEFGPFTWSELL